MHMEALLSLAFDSLTSSDGVKIRKGLRQVEGLLAQISLTKTQLAAAGRRRSLAPGGAATPSTPSPGKELRALPSDPAFVEFFKLQDGFQYNGKHFHAPSK